jgi:hypothetical protein
MKVLKILIILAIASSAASAADNHKAIPGPNGGKLLKTEPLHAEFFVQPDRKVNITFYDEAMKPVAPAEQVVRVIAEAPSGKTTLDFTKIDTALVSTTPLPAGEGYRIVVQVKQTPDAKPKNFRIDYHMRICGECKMAEYACICEGHSGSGHGGHAH